MLPVLPMLVDGVIYLIRNASILQNKMIVAYCHGTMVYAYKRVFNYNIDHDWTGGVLIDFKSVADNCQQSKNVQPAPSAQAAPSAQKNDPALLGLAFDKSSPNNHIINCDTIYGKFDPPIDCRWYDCFIRLLENVEISKH